MFILFSSCFIWEFDDGAFDLLRFVWEFDDGIFHLLCFFASVGRVVVVTLCVSLGALDKRCQGRRHRAR